MPAWNPTTERVEDSVGVALTSWEETLDRLDADPEAEPAVVMRFGAQVDIQGIIAPSRDADRAIRYLTKYLTKAVAETYTDPDGELVDAGYEAHIDRLHREVRWLPCSPECSNWIRYGIEPKNAGPGLIPGMCPNKAHDRENLGIGGRRVQVSRAWSGKTLAEHKADRATVVREVLAAAGVEAPATDRMSAEVLADDGLPRYVWEPVPDRPGRLRHHGAAVHRPGQAVADRVRARQAAARRPVARQPRRRGPGACGQPFGNHSPAASR